VVRGGFWVFALRIVDRLFKLVRTIVLARLLAPKDFGLFGIALLAMSALETFSETGFQAALIQKKGGIKPYLDTAWTVQVIRGAALALILFGIGPYVAAFFGEPAAATLLRVLGLSMLFQGFANIGVVYFQKELEFHKQFVYQLSGTPADFVVAITAAVLLRNAWALIFGLLAANFVRMVVSYLIHPYRPQVRFEGARARELYEFGRWILGSSILIFLLTQGDDVLVGKVLGASALGFYQMAYLISNLPATEITHVISQVTFPAYSKLQDNLAKLREAYLKTLQLTAFLSFPVAGLVFSLGADFTKVVLGEKWMPAVLAMQILSLYGLFRSFGGLPGSALTAIGEVSILPRVPLIQLVFVIALIYPMAVKFELAGVSTVVSLAVIFAAIYALRIGNKYLSIRFTSLVELVSPSIISVAAMLIVLGIANCFWEASFLSLVVQGIGGILIYVLLYSCIIRQNVFLYLIREYKIIAEH